MKTGMRNLFVVLVFAMALSSVAYADSVDGLFNTSGANTLLSDNSAEYLIKGVGNLNATLVEVGDILVGIVGINTIGPTTIGSGTIYNKVTAIQAVKIASAVDVDLGPIGPDDSFGPQNIDRGHSQRHR